MTFSLYDATVPTFQQILGSVARLLGKAEEWCAAGHVSEREILDARLAPDMLPFAYQVKSTVVHSIGAIEGIRRGEFSPDIAPPPESFTALKAHVENALGTLATISAEEINGFIGRDMHFQFKDMRMDFNGAEAFLMSFSLPNFMFHATTTYDLLRMKGLEIGKRDFMGKLALKR